VNPALPVVSGKEAARALETCRFGQVAQRGSQVKLSRNDGRTVVMPPHRELAPGTLRSVLRQAGLTVEEFIRLLRR
jgi:predicted RNA binding protein YcfA (HicA-like mRNA interferase family)